MSDPESVAVLGCGLFGAITALRLAEAGFRVSVFERNSEPLLGASYNNQNRLHMGFHYPRDRETALQCIRGFDRFANQFSDCLRTGFPNGYFVASEGSSVSPQDYIQFCDTLGLRYRFTEPSAYTPPVHNVDLGILTDELVIDCHTLRNRLSTQLSDAGALLNFDTDISEVEEKGESYFVSTRKGCSGPYRWVVNCTFADANRLSRTLGHAVQPRQYEYTAVFVVDWAYPPVGITIMDGKFMTLLPFGRSQQFLLYHVEHSVVDRVVADVMPARWIDPSSGPLGRTEIRSIFGRVVDDSAEFVPALRSARLRDVLRGPRIVLSGNDDTDKRPSMVELHEPGYITVFSGKLDHSIWAAEEVVRHVRSKTTHN